jgi:ADP-dependent NAD(P)H-hydrate dehydratase / NAD(P)H-hydrate epimerase
MKVLTADQMRAADRRTIASGTPQEVLMENAGRAVVKVMAREFRLKGTRVAVFCGKGNNGGDGRVVARLLQRRGARVEVIESEGGEITAKTRKAEIVVDALLGTGLTGPPRGRVLALIHAINTEFPEASKVAVDLPSGLGGGGESVRADITVTFAAPKIEHYFADGAIGKLFVEDIGIPDENIESDLFVSEPHDFAPLFVPRKADSNKGDFGHVLVIGGAPGKTGAAAMAGLAALRAGAGLVTVACSDSSRLAPELMSEPLDAISLDRKTVVAMGPGLGHDRGMVEYVMEHATVPTVIDADGLNSIAGTDFRGRGAQTILTPHPGEMARLTGSKVVDRLETARTFARDRNVCLVLKGHHTLIAFPDGRVWINPTGSPAMATGGTGDILTGMTAGLVAQHPGDIETAVRAAVWLHGRAGELGAAELTEQCLIATDLLHYLPRAIRECV